MNDQDDGPDDGTDDGAMDQDEPEAPDLEKEIGAVYPEEEDDQMQQFRPVLGVPVAFAPSGSVPDRGPMTFARSSANSGHADDPAGPDMEIRGNGASQFVVPRDLPQENVDRSGRYGIGAKLMAKMGYIEGQGLGRHGSGIVKPIETKARPQKLGVGGIKEKVKQSGDGADSDGDYDFSSDDDAEDVVRGSKTEIQAPDLFDVLSQMQRLDLTPPVVFQKISDDYHLAQADINRGPYINLRKHNDELQFAGVDIRKLGMQLSSLLDEWVQIAADESSASVDVKQSEAVLQRAKLIDQGHAELLAKLQTYPEHLQSSDAFAQFLQSFQDIPSSEEKEMTICIILQEYLKKIPFDAEDTALVDALISAKSQVKEFNEPTEDEYSYFESLVLANWIPQVKRFLKEDWSLSQPFIGLSIYTDWESVVGPKIAESVFEAALSRKFIDSIKEWAVGAAGPGPEVWYFEWKNHMPQQWSKLLLEMIMEKYQVYFKELDFEIFLRKKEIVPRELHLYREVTPNLRPVVFTILENAVRHFEFLKNGDSLIRQFSRMVKILKNELAVDTEYLDRVFQLVLLERLYNSFFEASKRDELQDLGDILVHWRNLLYESIAEYRSVKSFFVKLLDYCSLLMQGSIKATPRRFQPVIRTKEEILDLLKKEQWQTSEQVAIPKIVVSFKDVVEEFCGMHGLVLIPTTEHNNTNGQLVYRVVGGTTRVEAYMHDHVLFVREGAEWEPVSLDELAAKFVQ